jgi:hypothetical protein
MPTIIARGALFGPFGWSASFLQSAGILRASSGRSVVTAIATTTPGASPSPGLGCFSSSKKRSHALVSAGSARSHFAWTLMHGLCRRSSV